MVSVPFCLGGGSLILAISKVTLLPLLFAASIIYSWLLMRGSDSLQKINVLLWAIVLPGFLYGIVLLLTYSVYGSPFGSMFGELFGSEIVVHDPFATPTGHNPSLWNILILAITKFNLTIWIACAAGFLFFVKGKDAYIFAFFLVQLFVIYAALPEKPRHFQGIQYVLAFLTICTIYVNYQRFRTILLFVSWLSSLMYVGLFLYYTSPMIIKGYVGGKENFLDAYIPYYQDLKLLDKILTEDSYITTSGTRVNLYHLPRPELRPKDINSECVYEFMVGDGSPPDTGKLIYENPTAVKFTFRTPGRSSELSKLRVYQLSRRCEDEVD